MGFNGHNGTRTSAGILGKIAARHAIKAPQRPELCPRCGSPLFWIDRYHGETHCAGCYDPPSRAMVRQVLLIFVLPDGRWDLRDADRAYDDLDPTVTIEDEYIQWTEPDGRIVSAIRSVGTHVGPPRGMTWERWWAEPGPSPQR